MGRELTWISVIMVMSVLLMGLLTSFESIDVQLHDTYLVVGPIHAIIFLSILLIVVRYVFKFIVYLINRYRPFAVTAALIIPLMLICIALYMGLLASIDSLFARKEQMIMNQNDWILFPGVIFALSLIALEGIAIRKIVRKNQ